MPDFRSLPQVDSLSREPALSRYSEKVRIRASRLALEKARGLITSGNEADALAIAVEEAEAMERSSMEHVVNLSGVILHTGLGRARLAKSVAQHVAEVAARHSVVEYDLQEGKRGDRQDHVRAQICELTGAESALVVNNAAAAVLLTLSALAPGKEAILSRGQMVEIGGSFRMPDVVRASGCTLVEVGCTNKTHLHDYRDAITERTGAILRCHTSNYKIIGFTSTPSLAELVELAKETGVAVVDDQGTGCLVDTSRFGLPKQPTVQSSVASGPDVTIFSGDKLLGGPQAGIIAGKKRAIDVVRAHPIARAVRIDKLTLAALEGTLNLYIRGEELHIPTLAYLARSLDEIEELAQKLAAALGGNAAVEDGITQIGGGSAPGTGVRTSRVSINTSDPDKCARILRLGNPHIVSRIEDGKVWLDPRTVELDELEGVVWCLKSLGL